jgi:DnaK suppressor protein
MGCKGIRGGDETAEEIERMTLTQLGRLKVMLETRREELNRSLRNRDSIAVERTPEELENVGLAGERDLAMWRLDKRFVQLRAVEAALERVAGGTYGGCLHCEREIGLKRLAALPHASLCIICQESAEQGESSEPAVLKELAPMQIGK